MGRNRETYFAAVRFAKENGFKGILYQTDYNDCPVYLATSDALEGTCYGYPPYIIVNQDLKCRFSTPEESLDILDLI